jgi:hypothetical protein
MDEPTPQAPDPLTRTLEGLLPEAWRHDLAVARHPLGFTLQFSDAQGARHTVEAREAQPDAPALVTGRTLAYSYTLADASIDVAPILEEYRAVLTAIAAQEDVLLSMLDARATAAEAPGGEPARSDAGANPLATEPAAPEGFTALVLEALPEAWRRDVKVALFPGSFMVGFSDEAGHQHVLDVRKSGASPAFLSGPTLAYSYTLVDPRVAEDAVLEGYRAALAVLASREAEILPWLTPPAAAEGDGADGADRSPRDAIDYPDQGPATDALADHVVALLPKECRDGAEVVLTPSGFAVKFRDAASGIRHLLEARPLDTGFPALVRGSRFGFSYLKVDEALDEAAMVPRYREVLKGFVQHEAQLADDLAGASPA